MAVPAAAPVVLAAERNAWASFSRCAGARWSRRACCMIKVGAMVSPNVALNAGVAKGLNKNGKVGARAGFTVGW